MHRTLTLMIALCVTGCATRVDPHEVDFLVDSVEHSAGPAGAFDLLTVRVGVEYVPAIGSSELTANGAVPRPAFRAGARRAEPVDPVSVSAARTSEPPPVERSGFGNVWSLDQDEIQQVEDPYEQAVLAFVDDLVGEDRRRLQREFGAPMILTRSPRRHLRSLRNSYDERLEEEDAEFNNRVISGLVRRPFRHAIRGLPFVADIEAEYQEFKGDNVPVSSVYQDQNGGVGWGRVSGRLRLNDSFDPVEVSYLNFGWRVGTSQHYLRLEYDIELADGVYASVGWRRGYDNQTEDFLRTALHWRFDSENYLHVSAGDDLSFLGGPTAYTNVDSRLDGSRGALFFVEHLF